MHLRWLVDLRADRFHSLLLPSYITLQTTKLLLLLLPPPPPPPRFYPPAIECLHPDGGAGCCRSFAPASGKSTPPMDNLPDGAHV